MRLTRLLPTAALAPFVRGFMVLETRDEMTRVLVPESALVLGVRFSGHAIQLEAGQGGRLPTTTLAGMRTTARRMYTSANAGIVLTLFHETGAARFFAEPLHELFGQTVALDEVIGRHQLDSLEDAVGSASDHRQRVALVERFLLARQRGAAGDVLVTEAVRQIRRRRGRVRIRDVATSLGIGQDRFEKRFRRVVGASPKQLASLVRLRHAIASYRPDMSLADLSIEAGYFDQAHFNRELRAATGASPSAFFAARDVCGPRAPDA